VKRTSSNIRWLVVLILSIASFISYILRTNVSIAGDAMIADLGLTHIQFGFVLSAFAWGYALFQFPGGILGNVIGLRKTTTIISVCWAVLTLLTGFVPGKGDASGQSILIFLIVLRFLVGATHAPIFPVVGGTIGNWFPIANWALPNGVITTGLNLGAAATAPLIVALMVWGWRGSFFLTAPLGILTAVIWWRWIRDYPAEHPAISVSEVQLIEANRTPPLDLKKEKNTWKIVLKNRQVLLLTLSYFCMNYFFYLIFNWFFIYLSDIRKVPLQQAGYLTAFQYVIGSFGAILGGFLCDRFAKRFGARWGYRLLPLPCLVLASIFVIAGAFVQNTYAAVAFLALCSGLTQLADPVYWAAIVSVAGRHATAAGGVLNTGGNVVGGIGAILVPVIAHRFGWATAIASGSIFTLSAALLWLVIRADQNQENV
jgi:MFS transporter, ACS family, glucarate transporter